MNRIFSLTPHSNESYAFGDAPSLSSNQKAHQFLVPARAAADRPQVRRCRACGNILDKWRTSLAGLKVKKRNLDCGGTYDGVLVVSTRFKNWYDSHGFTGLEFRSLPDDSEFYAIRAMRTVSVDAGRRQVKFIGFCDTCERHAEVIGGYPVLLTPGQITGDTEFVATDLEFASYDEKSPILLCGQRVAKAIRKARLKGLIVEEQPQ